MIVYALYYIRIQRPVLPPVLLIPSTLERVLEQQIEAILICPGRKGARWWSQLVKLRIKLAPVSLQRTALCLRFPKERMEDLPKMDLLHTFNFSEKVK